MRFLQAETSRQTSLAKERFSASEYPCTSEFSGVSVRSPWSRAELRIALCAILHPLPIEPLPPAAVSTKRSLNCREAVHVSFRVVNFGEEGRSGRGPR